MSARCCMARKIVFVDEYRAPEQVMQLSICANVRFHLSYTAERPLRIMEVCRWSYPRYL